MLGSASQGTVLQSFSLPQRLEVPPEVLHGPLRFADELLDRVGLPLVVEEVGAEVDEPLMLGEELAGADGAFGSAEELAGLAGELGELDDLVLGKELRG